MHLLCERGRRFHRLLGARARAPAREESEALLERLSRHGRIDGREQRERQRVRALELLQAAGALADAA